MSSKVRETIAAHRERFLAELQELLAFPSVQGDHEALDGAAHWIADRLAAAGARAELWRIGDDPAVVFAEIGQGERSLLNYAHYDVQPPEPLALWVSPPYAPEIRDGKLFGRGASDDKGDILARIHAIEVYRAVYGELPLRLKFFIEGDEETGSASLAALAHEHRDQLRADGVLWEGGGFDDAERYTFYCGVKGIQYVELRVQGANHDLHSSYAPIAPNPAWRLVHALATLKDAQDRITIDGFRDHVREPAAAELAYMQRIPFAGAEMKRNWGIPAFINDMSDTEALVRYLTQPTCTICGLSSGYTGPGENTVLPSTASAKIDFRLTPDLTPELVLRLLREHLDRRGFDDVEIVPFSAMMAARSDVTAPLVQLAVETAREVYGHEPVVYPTDGASGPMYPLMQGLGMDGVMVGLCYSGANLHAPNENIRLADYDKYVEFLVEYMHRFGHGADR